MRSSEVIVQGGCFLLGLLALLGRDSLPEKRQGPALVLALCLLGLSLLYFLQPFVRKQGEPGKTRQPGKKGFPGLRLDLHDRFHAFRPRDFGVCLLAFLLYPLCIDRLGYLLSSALFCFALFYLLGRHWKRALLETGIWVTMTSCFLWLVGKGGDFPWFN